MDNSKSAGTAGGYNFGTFGGVYTPALLTILGLVMFMRTNFVLGSAGLVNMLIILAVGASISLATALSDRGDRNEYRGQGGRRLLPDQPGAGAVFRHVDRADAVCVAVAGDSVQHSRLRRSPWSPSGRSCGRISRF